MDRKKQADTTLTSTNHKPKLIHPLPTTGFVRLPQILGHFPVSKSTWWNGVKDGRFPKPVKLTERTTAWRVSDIHALIESLDNAESVAAN